LKGGEEAPSARKKREKPPMHNQRDTSESEKQSTGPKMRNVTKIRYQTSLKREIKRSGVTKQIPLAPVKGRKTCKLAAQTLATTFRKRKGREKKKD